MSLEILTAVIPAGETRTFMVNGQYIELIDAQYPVDVLMQDRQGGMVGTLKGAEVSFYSRPKQPFGQLQITSANAQTVRFFIGDGDAGTRRISSTVQVVDGEKARTLAGGMYSAAPGCEATAGNFPAVQLWNHGYSAKRLIVGQISVTCSTACAANVYFDNAFLGSSVRVTRLANKLAKDVPSAHSDVRVTTGGIPSVSTYSIWGAFVQPNGLVQWNVRGAIVLLPSSGLTIVGSVAGGSLGANFEWFEESL